MDPLKIPEFKIHPIMKEYDPISSVNMFTQKSQSSTATSDPQVSAATQSFKTSGQSSAKGSPDIVANAQGANIDGTYSVPDSSSKQAKNIFSDETSNIGKPNDILGVASNITGAASNISYMLNSNSTVTPQQQSVKSGISNIIAAMGPIGMGIKAVSDVSDVVANATGKTLDNFDTDAAKSAGAETGAKLNNALNYLPIISNIAGLVGTKTQKFSSSPETAKLAGAYGGTANDIIDAENLADKNSIFGTKKINSFISQQSANNAILANIGNINTLRKSSNGNDIAAQNINKYSGYTSNGIKVGKEGTKLLSVDEVHVILNRINNIKTFGVGGKMNIIPDGSLHAHLNHLDDVNPIFEDVTPKGIPVVATDKNGNISQVAEVEAGEIIFNLDLTNQLEKFTKDGSEEAMLEAGKLLAKEIITNTDDKTKELLNGKN